MMQFVANIRRTLGAALCLSLLGASGFVFGAGTNLDSGLEKLVTTKTNELIASPVQTSPDFQKIRNRPPVRLELNADHAVLVDHFLPEANPQEIKFERAATGRYFCLESLSSQDGRPFAAVAELDLLDKSGKPLNRTGWKIAYADSEEREREDGSAENAIDGNPTTYWHTQWSSASPNHPHHLVIDLGQPEVVTGFRYLPRPGEGNVGGRIKDYRIYVGNDLVTDIAQEKALPPKCFLFGYFTGSGEDGLHLAYSLNGYRWDMMGRAGSLLKPVVGQKLMRDPSIMLAPDGTFHLVWTAAWNGNYIGHATSKDLVHWSAQETIPVMASEPSVLNCWAPEVFWDASKAQFLIFWASDATGNSVTNAAKSDGPKNNRIYCTTTKDFKTFSPTRLMYDPGFSVVDATLLQDQNHFYLIFKDDSLGRLRIAVATHPDGPFGSPGLPFSPDYVEGPTAFHLGTQIVTCFHLMSQNRCGAVESTNLTDWKNISSGMFLPAEAEQGTVLEVPGETLKPLLEAGALEIGTTPEASEMGIGDWIWATNLTDRQTCRLWRAFDIPEDSKVIRASLRMTADNSYTAFLDGEEIGRGGDPNSLTEYDLTWLMTPGHHALAVEAFNDTLDAGVILGLNVELAGQKNIDVFSDPSWQVVTDNDHSWKTQQQADPSWSSAQVVGYAGKAWWQYPYQITRIPPALPLNKHFWQQTWFLIGLLVICLTVVVFSIRQGLQLAVQARSHRLLERERVRIARDIHDDLGYGLTQLTLLGELALRDSPGSGETRNQINELCGRTRVLLRSMDEIVWAVNPKRDTVQDFAAFISERAEEFLATTRIRCRQEVAAELPTLALDLPQRRNLMLAVKEAIRNAARHSEATEVNLKVQVVEQNLTVVVEDNGKGFSPEKLRTDRNGLTNLRQRLIDIGGTCTITSAPGTGCRVTFQLPLLDNKPNRGLFSKLAK